MKRSFGFYAVVVAIICLTIPIIAQIIRNREFRTYADTQIDLQIAAPPPLINSIVRLRDSNGNVKGLQGYDGTTGIGFIALVYTPLPEDKGKTILQILTAEERRAKSYIQAVVTTLTSDIDRTVKTWDNSTARISTSYKGVPYTANGLTRSVNDFTHSIASAFNPGLEQNSFIPVSSTDVKITTTFTLRTLIEYRNGNSSSSKQDDIVTVIAVIPQEKYDNPPAPEINMFIQRDLTDSTPLARYNDQVLDDVLRFGPQADPAVDFALVVDNSYSMDNQQRGVAASARSLRTALSNAGLNNFRIGLVTTSFYNQSCWPLANMQCDSSRNTSCRPFANTSRVDQMTQWLTVNSSSWIGAGTTYCQSGEEKGLLSLQNIMTPNSGMHASWMPPTTSSNTVNAQKLRQGSDLVIIMVGDADDQSYGIGLNGSLGTCQQGINNYTSWLRNLTRNGTFRSLTMGGIMCPNTEGITCGETQCTPRVIRSVINNFGGFIGDITTNANIDNTMQSIMRDVLGAASPYRLRHQAISTSVRVNLPRSGVTFGACPLSVPRSLKNGFDYDYLRNSVVLYGNCRPTKLHSNETINITYSYWTRDFNCNNFKSQEGCNLNNDRCFWCPARMECRAIGMTNADCPIVAVDGLARGTIGTGGDQAALIMGFGKGNNGGIIIDNEGSSGVPWWAILLLILFLLCLCCLCLALLFLAFLAAKREKEGKPNRNDYQQGYNPGAAGGLYAPPADPPADTTAPYATPSASGSMGGNEPSAGSAGSGEVAGNPPSGGAPSGGSPMAGIADARSNLRPGRGRPLTVDTGITPGDQGDPNIRPDDNKYIFTGGTPRWPG